MTSFGKIGKYLIYIQNLLYILCFIKTAQVKKKIMKHYA